MTTQPSDWAVELLPCPFCGSEPAFNVSAAWCPKCSPTRAFNDWNTRAPVARELDASGDAPRAAEAGDSEPVAWDFHVSESPRYPGDSMRDAVWSAESAEQQRLRGYEVRPLYACQHPSGNGDKARLDWIERTYSGMTNRERYLPVVMIWGKGANGRTLREAIDKYMERETMAAAGD